MGPSFFMFQVTWKHPSNVPPKALATTEALQLSWPQLWGLWSHLKSRSRVNMEPWWKNGGSWNPYIETQAISARIHENSSVFAGPKKELVGQCKLNDCDLRGPVKNMKLIRNSHLQMCMLYSNTAPRRNLQHGLAMSNMLPVFFGSERISINLELLGKGEQPIPTGIVTQKAALLDHPRLDIS